jgi:ferredoxin
MSRFGIELDTGRCQSYGSCLSIAPTQFAWTRAQKVRLVETGTAPDKDIIKAAKLCPYRAIAVIDVASGARIFPPPLTR